MTLGDIKDQLRKGDEIQLVRHSNPITFSHLSNPLGRVVSTKGLKYQDDEPVKSFTPVEITWENLQKGDQFTHTGTTFTVVETLGEVVFFTNKSDNAIRTSSKRWIQRANCAIVQRQGIEAPKVREMTVAEVEKLVGQPVKIVKERDEE